MTPSTKKLCIYGLATGIGEMLQKQSQDEQVQWRALKLAEAGQDCIDNCKIKIDSSAVARVEKRRNKISTSLSFVAFRDTGGTNGLLERFYGLAFKQGLGL